MGSNLFIHGDCLLHGSKYFPTYKDSMVFQGDPNASVCFTLGNFSLELKNYNAPLPVGVSKIKASNYVLYPNPVKDFLNITHQEGSLSGYSFKLFHINGQLLLEDQIEFPYQQNIQNLPPGLYLLKVTDSEGNTFNHKIIKQ